MLQLSSDGVSHHVHILLKRAPMQLHNLAIKQGVPKDIIRKDADSKEGLIACLYEWSDVAKAEGTQGQETPVSKHIREGGFDDNPIDPTVSSNPLRLG